MKKGCSQKEILDDSAPMVLIPAGEFMMGSDSSRHIDEKLVRKVYIDAFYIDKYEVTNEQYKQFIDAGGYNNSFYWTTEGLEGLKMSKIISKKLHYWDDATYGYIAPNGREKDYLLKRSGRKLLVEQMRGHIPGVKKELIRRNVTITII